MKKIATILILVFAFTFTAQAQKRGKAISVEKMLEKLTTDLSLTVDQQNKIKPLLEAQVAERKTMRDARKATQDSGQRPSKEEHEKQMKIRAEKEAVMNTKMAEILDEEQFSKYETLSKEKVDNGKRGDKKRRQ